MEIKKEKNNNLRRVQVSEKESREFSASDLLDILITNGILTDEDVK